jgi:hypothetical protein
MPDATRADHTDEDTVGRHRGEASEEDTDAAAPQGRHRREGPN